MKEIIIEMINKTNDKQIERLFFYVVLHGQIGRRNKMTYPKKVMKTAELVEMGFPRSYLMQMAHVPGQTYATRLPGGRNIYWDTEKFERERLKHVVR